jgi:hypothetical protein
LQADLGNPFHRQPIFNTESEKCPPKQNLPQRIAHVPIKFSYPAPNLDNKERRKIVQDAITMAGMVWHGMEIFTASTRPTVEECRRFAKEADVLVGIIAWRYGWEPDGKKSITEMEYDAAKQRLMFLIDPSLPVKPEMDYDPGPEWWEKLGKLEKFKARFSADQMPTLFKETTLQAKVMAALNQWRERRERPPKKKSPARKKKPTRRTDPKLAAEFETIAIRPKPCTLRCRCPALVSGCLTAEICCCYWTDWMR